MKPGGGSTPSLGETIIGFVSEEFYLGSWKTFLLPGQAAHPCARDEVEVLLARRVEEGHGPGFRVVGSHPDEANSVRGAI